MTRKTSGHRAPAPAGRRVSDGALPAEASWMVASKLVEGELCLAGHAAKRNRAQVTLGKGHPCAGLSTVYR